jgi:hypothetical protein
MRDAAGPAEPGPAGRPGEVLRFPAFAFFWSATTIRAFGGAISGVAFQVLIVTVLHATPVEISIFSALSVVPYVFLGLIVGALMDRWRRQRTLVITSIGRAVALASITILLLLNALSFWSLAIVTVILGVLVLFADSASQPLLPRIVPRDSLVMANARLGQSSTVAGTAGPALGGALLNLLGAPVLFLFDAVITAVSAVLQARIKVVEPKPAPRADGRHIGHDIAEGMRYTYRHRTLRPLALSVHTWFLGTASCPRSSRSLSSVSLTSRRGHTASRSLSVQSVGSSGRLLRHALAPDSARDGESSSAARSLSCPGSRLRSRHLTQPARSWFC